MLVRTTIKAAHIALGMDPSTVHKLIDWKLLSGQHSIGKKSWVEYDDAWTKKDIWLRFVERDHEFVDEMDVLLIGDIKRALGVLNEPWLDPLLEALVKVRQGRKMNTSEGRRLFRGSNEVWLRATARYNELNQGSSTGGRSYAPIDLEKLMEDSPEAMQGLPGTCIDEDRGILFEAPEPWWMARVGEMRPGCARWAATLVILVHPTHGGTLHGAPSLVAILETLDERIGDADLSDESAMLAAVNGIAGDLEGTALVSFVQAYQALRDLVGAYLEWQKIDEGTEVGALLRSLLPADLPSELRQRVVLTRSNLTVETLKARALKAGEVARRAVQRLTALKARLRQWERLCNVTDHAIKKITDDLDAGREVRFPVRVSDTWKVVRPDGSIAPGLRQTVDVEIMSEDRLWMETAEASGWDQVVGGHLSAEQRGRSPSTIQRLARSPKFVRPGDGASFRPGGERRFHVRYVGTSPAAAEDDEHHAPYLLELYAASALVQSALFPREHLIRRNAVVDRYGLERASQPMMGLTWWTESTVLPHLLLRHTGGVILPMHQLRLTVAYGCLVARLELLSGMRIGETMQARHGGCFTNQELDGRVVATMRGRPKGWRRDRLWIVDRETMDLLIRIKTWVVANWYADLGTLPIVAYGEKNKNLERLNCPPARYLLQLGGVAARHEHLSRCLRIVTLGMPHADSHDYRYAFAKLLRIRRATRRQRARAMSHEEGSGSVDRYGNWDCEGLEDDDAIVAKYQDDLARELLDGLIDHG